MLVGIPATFNPAPVSSGTRGPNRLTARKGGKRIYGDDELHLLAVAKGLLSLDEITTIVHGPARGQDWRAAVRRRLTTVQEQQAALAHAEEYLNHFLTCPNDNPVDGCRYLRADTARMLAGNQ